VIKGPLWSSCFLCFLRNRSSDNIESNTKTLFNENETRLLRKMVYGV
jgi:hypothetical protein